MKLGYKLVISFLTVTVIMGAFGFYMFNNVSSKLSNKQDEIRKVSELTLAIQDFHIENIHTQLEMWEYAYEPNEKRLNAFYSHFITWEKLFSEFTTLANEADLNYEEIELFNGLQTGIILVRQSWVDFVQATESVSAGTIDTPALNADGTEKYEFLDKMGKYGYYYSYPMFDMRTAEANNPILYDSMIAMEVVFDEAEFNKNTDKFVLLQQEKIEAKQTEMNDLKSSLSTQFIIAFVIVLIVAISTALVLTRMIVRPISNLTKLANDVSQGKTDLTVPKIQSKDEIGDLAKSFGRVVASIKFMMTDKEG